MKDETFLRGEFRLHLNQVMALVFCVAKHDNNGTSNFMLAKLTFEGNKTSYPIGHHRT